MLDDVCARSRFLQLRAATQVAGGCWQKKANELWSMPAISVLQRHTLQCKASSRAGPKASLFLFYFSPGDQAVNC
jgi:hypothetical protein